MVKVDRKSIGDNPLRNLNRNKLRKGDRQRDSKEKQCFKECMEVDSKISQKNLSLSQIKNLYHVSLRISKKLSNSIDSKIVQIKILRVRAHKILKTQLDPE